MRDFPETTRAYAAWVERPERGGPRRAYSTRLTDESEFSSREFDRQVESLRSNSPIRSSRGPLPRTSPVRKVLVAHYRLERVEELTVEDPS